MSITVHDGGNFNLDGNVGPTTPPNPTFVIGTPGSINNTPLWHVSKFRLDVLLPAGTASADIVSATLSVPDMDLVRNHDPLHPREYASVVQHFAAGDETTITNADGGFSTQESPTLAQWLAIPAGGTGSASSSSTVEIDVTAAVKDDLDNARALSSYRFGHDPAGPLGASSNYTFPDSNGVGTAFEYANMMRLTVVFGPVEDCTNGVDDDGDGFVDCDDAECVGAESCPSRLPDACFENVADYTYMWWAYGLRDTRRVFNIQTSRYGLSFDYDALELTRFGPIADPLPESQALREDNSVILDLPAASLECTVEANGQTYRAVSAGPEVWACKLSESGKFFQRRWLEAIHWSPTAPPFSSKLEVAAWPDRVAFSLHVTPTASAISDGVLELTIDVDGAFSEFLSHEEGRALCAADDSGFVFVAGDSTDAFTVDAGATTATVRVVVGEWPVAMEKVASLVVYATPTGCGEGLQRAVASEVSPLVVEASKQLPVRGQLPVAYDRRRGWHRIQLDDGGYSWPDNDWIQRVFVGVQNPSPFPRVVRLNFEHEGGSMSITGISAILRDVEQYPTGVPIQISKNWHVVPSWYRGLTMLTVPPQSSVVLEYTRVYAHWGGVASASHAQLSLIGWVAGFQLWDEAAMGSWGESITFNPDTDAAQAMVADVRPLMVWAMERDTPTMWTWTNNVGGGDFLVYFDQSGQKQWNSRMRTRYRRYCPNLTEVTYAGRSQDSRIDVYCTASLYRSDDVLRVVYRLRYDVREPVAFTRLAFFQLGADHYNENQFNLMARGDGDGLLEEWSPPWGGWSYSRIGIPATGESPWFSLHDAISGDDSQYGAWANRGLVIRSWEARLGGANAPIPYAAVFGTQGGVASAILELSAPPGVTQLLPGDYVDAEVVQVVMPQFASDYYGPNDNLRSALASGENTWRMIHREAVGNQTDVEVIQGTLEATYPVRVRAADGSCAWLSVSGGLGYVPITITGLSDYRSPPLQKKVNGIWTDIDQSVHGNDFWQTDYDAVQREWELTYTIPMDTPGDVRQTHEFRLHSVGCAPPPVGADFDGDTDVDQEDFGRLQSCLTGPAWVGPECSYTDLDQDNHVDQNDLDIFLGCMSGANVPADPTCLTR